MFIPESDEVCNSDITDIEKGIIRPRYSVYDDKSMELFSSKFDKPTWSEWIKSRWFSRMKQFGNIFDHINTRQKEYTRPSPYDIHLKFETCYKHWLAEFEIATGKKD